MSPERWFRQGLWIALIASSAAASPSASDIEELRADARTALADGRFETAAALYGSLLKIAPRDPHALREGGRAAHAARDFSTAAALLGRAASVVTEPDPELHYLLGEALAALGRDAEARIAYLRARTEIGNAPSERLPKLWLARIHAKLGDRAAAEAIYDALTFTSPADAEVVLAKAELQIAEADWSGAEETIDRFLSVRPTHRKAREMLAWITEARGQLARELQLRAALASGSTTAEPVRDYGRALERAGDWSGALAMYNRAHRLSGGPDDVQLAIARRRMEQRMSIEVAAGAVAKSDPTAESIGGFTGVALPFGRAHHLAFGASHERLFKTGGEGSASELFAALSMRGAATHIFGGGRLAIVEVGGDEAGAMQHAASTTPAAFGGIRRAIGRRIEIGVDGEINALWREAPRAMLEGGRSDAVTTHLWAFGFDRRLVIDSGVQARRLQLRSEPMNDATTSQWFAWGGADVALWTDFSQQARGEVLDESMLQPTFLASSIVASYRHYELFSSSNTAFADRMSLADRASIEDVSLTFRRAGLAGRVAVEARTGLGYDWARELVLARGGLSLWIATSSASRLSLTLDLAKESARALAGERLSGGMTYHVDL